MKKIIILFLILIFCGLNKSFADENCALRDYTEIIIPQGTFIPVINSQEISTFYSDIGTKVQFICPTDLYIYETNVIPTNSEIFGYIEQLREPIAGTNASMKIKVVRLKLPDGTILPMRGYIYTKKGNIIGGEQTAPASYDTKPSFRQGCKKAVGYVPGASRKMGEHKTIAPGTDLLVVLTGPIYITHTVTN